MNVSANMKMKIIKNDEYENGIRYITVKKIRNYKQI